MNDAIALKTSTPTPHNGDFGADTKRALKLVIGGPGLLDTLQFIEDPGYDAPLVDGDVEFKVHAAGLNFLDVMIALGQMIGNNLGVKGAGVVTRVAPGCTRFEVGDHACGIAAGTLNAFACAKETSLAKIPATLSFAGATGFTVVFVTAYAALYDIADIQPGESVLIHAAAGGVGQACIQLAQVRGAEIYATVGSVEKRDLLMKTYGIVKDHIFSSRDLTFAQGIKRRTKGRGVDVAVNSLSGDALRATWDCIAPYGRFVEVGKIDIYSSARLNMEKFKKNVSFEFVDISFIASNNGPSFSGILGSLMELVRNSHIGPLNPTRSFPFSQIQASFRHTTYAEWCALRQDYTRAA
ncbi:NAD(P)-binding protein [Xylona heveae TC161]|uniref:NAD(P)-binding protein n=1 Tax=Xylona heveae (strain CBS 132557 / TC161) TaxID=1328760 RepID=A0A165GEL7_XYLHT|nr:NAD(P)-binding protein [Xylona heveae TC161]KZF22096.1 NAD(P)-binding protein [Xylona heveae TC161]